MTEAKEGVTEQSPFIAYIAPIAIFALIGSLESQKSLASWYPVIYAVKIVGVVAALFYFRRSYPKFSSNGLGLGVLFGIIGIVVWIGLAKAVPTDQLPEAVKSWIGGQRVGFDPNSLESPVRYVVLALRLIGLVLVVPIMEEIFWRGFLLRVPINENFEKVPLGTFSWLSFAVVTVCFTLAHPELLAAAVWCAGINGLLYLTRNLWACVVAHAVTNLLLGIYVLYSGEYSFW